MASVFPSAMAAISGAGTAPPAVGGVIATIPPLTAAGVDLARRTMWMIALSVVILVLLLFVQEFADHGFAAKATDAQLAMIEAGTVRPPDEKIARLAAEFRHAALDPKWLPSPDETTAAKTAIAQAQQAPSIIPAQITKLTNCMPFPVAAAANRATSLQDCANVLDILSNGPVPTADRTAFIETMQKALTEERAARRAFWLQVAQLILINLLLPILTALLGYIFGTRAS